jgi:ATP-binding cassette subfamily C (CFTR/MRP) protein 1
LRAVNVTSTSHENDNSFGPFLGVSGTTTFDFTLLFEETILTILPAALLLLLIPLRVLRLWKTPRKITSSNLRTVKIVTFLPCSL